MPCPALRRALAALVFAACALPLSAAAQIVNVQSLAGKPVEPGVSGDASVSLDWIAGNTQILNGAAGVSAWFKSGDSLVLAAVKGAYGIKGQRGQWNEDPYQEKIFEHLRFRQQFGPTWSVEAFGQHEFDRWRRLRFRALAGGGPRADLAFGERVHAGVGVAYMAQWEELLDPKPGDPDGIVLEHRLSSYVTGAWKIAENVGLSGTVYVQPRLDAPTDARGLVDATLTVALSERLALKLVHGLSWDTRPPQTVRGYDAATKVALGAKF